MLVLRGNYTDGIPSVEPSGNASPTAGNATLAASEADLTFVVLAFCYPLLLALCTVGNGLNLLVLLLEKKKSAANCFMTAVAVADLTLLWSGVFMYIWNTSSVLHTTYASDLAKLQLYYSGRCYFLWAQEWSIQFCDWTLIVFSLERLLAVLYPFRFRWLQAAWLSRLLIVAVFLLTGALTVFSFVIDYIRWRHDAWTDDARLPAWVRSWRSLQGTAELTIFLCKFFGLFLINAIVIVALRRQQQTEVGRMRLERCSSAAREHRQTTLLLVGSVGLYLFAWFPSVVYTCLQLAEHVRAVRLLSTPVCYVFMYVNYSANCLVYALVSAKYREELRRILAPVMCPLWLRERFRSVHASLSLNPRGSVGTVTSSVGDNEIPLKGDRKCVRNKEAKSQDRNETVN
ncbi:uncharacterized protein LOC129591044 [Paramacrobiotus metropolitanus]|uniref:uncharacterized protein LOC129591044 n=1 Tax=Paramacrobiotus metropolitanus TaxID=2943436 RepID=UPI002445F6C1|nr:uncharacterized protein LOC129591044 [Paramacrobiotus metropolitanus]